MQAQGGGQEQRDLRIPIVDLERSSTVAWRVLRNTGRAET